jgi:hypothetical protein
MAEAGGFNSTPLTQLHGLAPVSSSVVANWNSLTGICNVNSVYNLLDPRASFTPGALVGLTILNVTDGSSGIITINTATTCTVGGGLSGGTNNTWTLGDTYKIILLAQTVCVIGASGVRYKVHSLIIDISLLIGNITPRMFISVNGNQRQIFPPTLVTPFVVGTNAPGIALINGTFGIANALTVTAQSDNIADNGIAIGFEYFLEAM